MKLLLQLFLVIFIVFDLPACSCMEDSYSFSLQAYDAYYDVLEVSFYRVDHQERDKLRRDSIWQVIREWKGDGPPPPPPPPPGNDVFVYGVARQSFKGMVTTDSLTFQTSRDGGMCGWIPQLNERYIVYVGKPHEKDGVMAYGLSLCQRKRMFRSSTSAGFADELSTLRSLRDQRRGNLAPVEHLKGREFDIDFHPFEGKFRRGKRHGVWTVYQPMGYWDKDRVTKQVFFTLTYKKGRLIRVTPGQESDNEDRNRWAYWMRWTDWYAERAH